jgi:hypothetical protein
MKTTRPFAWITLCAAFAWVLAGGCSAGGGAGDLAGGPSGSGSAGSGGRGDPTVLEPDASTNGGRGNDDLNPLCGEGACLPDDANACRDYEPPPGEPNGGAAGASSLGGDGGQGGGSEGGASGQSASGAAGENATAGAGGQPSEGGASGAGGSTGGAAAGSGGEAGAKSAEPPALASYSCQVVRQGNLQSRQCGVAGTGKVNAPCFSAADCAPSLACVTEGDAGRCLPYCCGVDSTCPGGTYCADRDLRKAPNDSSQAEPPRVPVCVPTDDCSLEDRYPCMAGEECRCKGDTACMVVREDGTTTCMKPGPGQQGETCPCAWNHVCSSLTNKCVKICRTDPAKQDCGEQKCQASSELPSNFGVCVGPVK